MRKPLILFLNIKNFVYPKYWTDPVWSKVISAGILILIGSFLTIVGAVFKSIYSNISFELAIKQIITYFTSSTKINNLLFLIICTTNIYMIIKFAISFIGGITNKNNTKEEIIEFPIINETSTEFFSNRLAKAFPGRRGLKWYDAKTSVERLKILFRDPLQFRPSEIHDHITDPIWYFRGSQNLPIRKFKYISKSKIILGHDELEIKRIAVYVSQEYHKSFIYLEAKGEEQTGLYKFSTEDKRRYVEAFGYHSEEYALIDGNKISREQYDDGAAIINGKVIDASGAELRIRYISDYNIIISAKKSPYNLNIFDRESREYLDKILQGKQNPEQFFKFLETLKRNEF